jgi:hypothetical protein
LGRKQQKTFTLANTVVGWTGDVPKYMMGDTIIYIKHIDIEYI